MKDQFKPTLLRVTRPKLLMLSHCVPDAMAQEGDRARAWQLLASFSQSHEVLLACVADGAVSLSQWRLLHGRAKQIVMEPIGQLRRWTSRAMKLVAPAWSMSLLMHNRLQRAAREWSASGEIESVLCTRLPLMDAALLAGDCQRIVDHHADMDLNSQRATHATTWIINGPEQAKAIAAMNKRTILLPASAPLRDQPSIRLVTDDDDSIIMPTAPLQKAA